jgi:hypothetical protein
MIVKSLGNDTPGKRTRKIPRDQGELYGCIQNKAALSCVCVLPVVNCALKRQVVSFSPGKAKKRPKSN